jgi:hypothetical protein
MGATRQERAELHGQFTDLSQSRQGWVTAAPQLFPEGTPLSLFEELAGAAPLGAGEAGHGNPAAATTDGGAGSTNSAFSEYPAGLLYSCPEIPYYCSTVIM